MLGGGGGWGVWASEVEVLFRVSGVVSCLPRGLCRHMGPFSFSLENWGLGFRVPGFRSIHKHQAS